MTLWVFGHSVCLPTDLENTKDGWPELLSKKLGIGYKNFAQPAADNFYIYSSYVENKKHIQPSDIVIVGWSHPNRKSFVLDRENSNHMLILNESLTYNVNGIEFIRSKNKKPSTFRNWLGLTPKDTGKQFYDVWFNNYYSEYEQKINLQSYYDSVKLTCNGLYIPFFFSEESIANINVVGAGFILEFIIENQVAISDDNIHPSATGHKIWSEHLYNEILKHEPNIPYN